MPTDNVEDLPSNCYYDSSNKMAICLSNVTNDITCPYNNMNNIKKGNTIISDYYENIGGKWSCNNSVYNCNISPYNNCTNTLNINGNSCVILSNSTSASISASVTQEDILCIDSNSKKLTQFVSNDYLNWQTK
jgi:hypothetical protein